MRILNVNIILIWMALITTTIGCVKKEKVLTPTPEPENIYGDHTLPQGNHEYDSEIVAFYKKYNTLILYKYEDKDIFWNMTQSIGQVSYDGQTDITTRGYQYTPADENYIGPQLELLKTQFFKYFTDDLLKKYLPRKIFLMDHFTFIEGGKGKPEQQARKEFLVTSGVDYIAVAGGREDILSMKAEDKRTFRGQIVYFFLQQLIARGVAKPIAAFTNLTNYSLSMPTWDLTYGNGIVDWNRRQPNSDWEAYVEMITTTTYEDLIGPGGFLSPGIDKKGVIRKKYEVMINYFKSEFNIDLSAIGNDL